MSSQTFDSLRNRQQNEFGHYFFIYNSEDECLGTLRDMNGQLDTYFFEGVSEPDYVKEQIVADYQSKISSINENDTIPLSCGLSLRS